MKRDHTDWWLLGLALVLAIVYGVVSGILLVEERKNCREVSRPGGRL